MQKIFLFGMQPKIFLQIIFKREEKKEKEETPSFFNFFTRQMANDVIFCAQSSDCTKITRTNNNRKELTTFNSII